MQVSNHDMVSLVRRMRRFKKELVKSVSSGINEFNEHDQKRLNSYIIAIKEFKSWMTSQPILDLPETSPMIIEVEDLIPSSDLENDDLALLVKLFEIIEAELVNSASARRSTGLVTHDAVRFDSYVVKIEKFLSDFLSQTNPMDLPESSPMVVSTGHGNRGI